jgi:hypothetical protein
MIFGRSRIYSLPAQASVREKWRELEVESANAATSTVTLTKVRAQFVKLGDRDLAPIDTPPVFPGQTPGEGRAKRRDRRETHRLR